MKDFVFGNLLTRLRSEKGYSQYQLGQLIGVSDKAVSKWENGSAKPRMSTCCKLAEVLGVSLDVLLSAGNLSLEETEGSTPWTQRAMKKGKQIHSRKDDAPVKRIELHAKTGMSALDGLGSATDLIARAANWGHRAIAITDFHSLQGFPEAMSAAGRNGIKLIPGCEFRMYTEDAEKSDEYAHVMLLAATREGIVNLNHLMTAANLDCPHDQPGITRKWINQHRKGLLVGCSCNHGEIREAILAQKDEDQIQRIAAFYDYLEIQPPENEKLELNRARELVRNTVSVGRTYDIAVTAVGNVHYLEPEDGYCRSVYQYNLGRIDDENPGTMYFRTTDEMLRQFAFLGAKTAQQVVIDMPCMIADRIQNNLTLYPERKREKGAILPFIPNSKKNTLDVVQTKAYEVYGNPLPTFVEERLSSELKIIEEQDSWIYFAVARHLMSAAGNNGYRVGTRGAVGSSFVAWLAGITDVNPLMPHYRCLCCHHSEWADCDSDVRVGMDLPARKCPCCGASYIGDGMDIPIETFLGFRGNKSPDIDLNFPYKCIDQIQEQLVEVFGKGHVVRAGTIEVTNDLIGRRYARQYMIDHNQFPSEERLEHIADKLCCTVRAHGMDSYGYVIVPREYCLEDFTAADRDDESHEITTHYDFGSMRGALMKMDCMISDSLSLLHQLGKLTGIDPYTVPLHDEKVMMLFQSADTLDETGRQLLCETGTYGIPEFDGACVRKMLYETQPKTINELILISGLSHGTGVWKGNGDILIRSGEARLCDLPALRDDIMNTLTRKGMEREDAYRIMEKVRMGRGLSEQMEAQMRRCGIEEWYINFCKKVLYMFPKAHAAAYVFASLRIAWFKVYQPAAFYRAWFELYADVLNTADFGLDADKLRQEILSERSDDKRPDWEKVRMRGLELLLEMKIRKVSLNELKREKPSI